MWEEIVLSTDYADDIPGALSDSHGGGAILKSELSLAAVATVEIIPHDVRHMTLR